MDHRRVVDIVNAEEAARDVTVMGWVRTRRDAKGFSFLEIGDGSSLKTLQAVVDADVPGYETIQEAATGSAVEVVGDLLESPGKGQKWELKAKSLRVLGTADPEEYPLQKKRHSDEYLRTIAHLRPRTNKYGAMFRIRSEASFAVHDYFRSLGFIHLHSPVITGSDCEGAGELFRVTSHPADSKAGDDEDFFGRGAYLTVSGQLAAEVFAASHGRVYTFGPTFRAEKSHTPRHAAEFWMIEPEMAFCDLACDMDLAEDFLKHVVSHVRETCADDLELFARFVDKKLPHTLDMLQNTEFVRLSYGEAMDILASSGQDFEFPVGWGEDLQTEHERYLCEQHFKRPVFVHDYPKEIKAFYMRSNDDSRTVAAMDLLVPVVGELVGGSQREERLDVLKARLAELCLPAEEYWWYLELRKYGSVPHAGFGLGFERLLMALTGVSNIRDVIAFPRTLRSLEF